MKRSLSRLGHLLLRMGEVDSNQIELERIRRKLASVPRRQEGLVSTFGWELEYVDAPALISGLETLVVNGMNNFTSRRDNPVILDCGANIGLSVLNYRRKYPSAHIIAFEPDPKFAAVLRGNLERNGAIDVTVIEAAVWIEQGTAQFICEGADGSRLITDTHSYPEALEVPTVDLADHMQDQIDLIKMDIEGAESIVIHHLKERLRLVDQMIIECHVRKDAIRDFSLILRNLEEAGFHVSIHTYGGVQSLVHRPPRAPHEFDQYVLIAAWRQE